jgi:hypothetical protein
VDGSRCFAYWGGDGGGGGIGALIAAGGGAVVGGRRRLRLMTSATEATTTTTTTTPTIAHVQGNPEEDPPETMAEYWDFATDTGSGPAWRLNFGPPDELRPKAEVFADSSTPTNPEFGWK